MTNSEDLNRKHTNNETSAEKPGSEELLEKLAVIERRLCLLESRASDLSSEVGKIRKSFDDIRGSAGISDSEKNSPRAVFSAEVPSAAPRNARRAKTKAAAGHAVSRPGAATKTAGATRAEKRKTGDRRSLEQFIGRNAMGAGASVLVLVAMVMFATLLLPYIGQELKCAAMYIFSLALIAAGEWVYKRQKNGYLILSACGAGALFVSLFATKIYFHYINSMPLYCLLLIWAGLAAYMSRMRHFIYGMIGQTGIFAAMCIASVGLITPADLYLSFGFLIIAEGMFYFASHRREYKSILINTIGVFLALAAFEYGAHSKIFSIRYSVTPLSMALMAAAVAVMAAAAYYLVRISDAPERYTLSGIISLAGGINAYAACRVLESAQQGLKEMRMMGAGTTQIDPAWSYGLLILYFAAVMAAMIRSRKVNEGKKDPLPYISYVMGLAAVMLLPSEASYIVITAVIAVLALSNYRLNSSEIYSLTQATAVFALIPIRTEDRLFAGLIILALILAQMVYSRVKNPGERMPRFEIASYLTSVALAMMLTDMISEQLWKGSHFMGFFTTVSIFVVMQIAARETDWTDSDSGRIGVFHLTNLAVMIYALFGFDRDMSMLEMSLYSLLCIGLYSINLLQLTYIRENLGAYIGIKYTVLAGAALYSLEVPGYIYSIVFLVLAVACVVAGFRFGNKSIRLYGLILSMLCILKLIAIDINYSNTVMRAVSFLVSGLICFGISLIYNHIDKKHKSRTNQGAGAM